jgi:hypothetical protein
MLEQNTWLYNKAMSLWLWIGTKLLGYPFVDVYAPGDGTDNPVQAITFSYNELYIKAIADVEVYQPLDSMKNE